MPKAEPAGALGGWSPEELRSTLQQFSGAGADSDIDDDGTRFFCGVARLVRRREAVDHNGHDPRNLSVFLLSPDASGQCGLERDPTLETGQTTIAGKVWFVSPAVVSGKARQLEATDADSVFRTVTDDLGLGHVPAAVVDPRGQRTEVRYYPKGLAHPDNRRMVRLHCSDVDLPQVCDVIQRVYEQCLVTPDAQSQGNRLWTDPRQFRPYTNAEHRVQAYLKPAFAAALPTCRIYDEFAGTMGRADLHIEEPDPLNRENVTFLAVLELKVLRSYSDSGNTTYADTDAVEWIKKGVKQAGTYRRERGHRVAVLCCFDMRKEDTGEACFSGIRDLAEEQKVALRRWYLYASSELARDAFTTTPSA